MINPIGGSMPSKNVIVYRVQTETLTRFYAAHIESETHVFRLAERFEETPSCGAQLSHVIDKCRTKINAAWDSLSDMTTRHRPNLST